MRKMDEREEQRRRAGGGWYPSRREVSSVFHRETCRREAHLEVLLSERAESVGELASEFSNALSDLRLQGGGEARSACAFSIKLATWTDLGRVVVRLASIHSGDLEKGGVDLKKKADEMDELNLSRER